MVNKGKTCEVEGCDREDIKARGLCFKHYERKRRGVPLTGDARRKPRGMSEEIKNRTSKRCPICHETKGRDGFYIHKKGHFSSYCKKCTYAKRRIKEAKEKANRPPKPPKQPRVMPKCAGPCDRTAKNYYQGNKQEPYCPAHYNQRWAGKELTPLNEYNRSFIDENIRKCTACEQILPVGQFHKRTDGTRQGRCRTCHGLAVRLMLRIRQGRLEEAVELTESMCERLRNKYVPKVVTALNQREFERSNEKEAS